MNNIQSYQSNSRLICTSNMPLVHIGSDCRHIAGVFLEHTHPAMVALSSSRELSMQGDALFQCYLAGRFNNPSIHPPPSRLPLDLPIFNCANACLTVG
jgi:hypothetical protein